MRSKNDRFVVYIGAFLFAIVSTFPARAHNGDYAHSAPAVPQANVPLEMVAGAVMRMVVENKVTQVTTQYVALRADDGQRVTLKGKALEALLNGARAEAIGWRNGSTFAVSDFRTVAARHQTASVQATSISLVEGTLLLAHLDFFDSGRGDYVYLVRDDTGHVTQLNLATGEGLEPGMRVIARGTLATDGASVDVDELTILDKPAPKLTGEEHPIAELAAHNVLVVLVKFNDSPAGNPFTQAQVQQVMSTASNSVANYYQEVSYGQQTLNVTVTTWLTANMATPASGTCPWQSIGTAADAVVNPATYPGPYQNRFYVFPQWPNGCGWAGLAYIGFGQAWSNGYNQVGVYAHELGHNFGLYHAASLQCSGGASIGGTCTSTEYGDPFDVMGNLSTMHFNAMQKAKLTWIPATSVKTHGSGSQQYTLNPLENSGGTTYAVTIPIAANPDRAYWVEYRQPIGFDASLPAANGAQIRVANPFETNCSGCVSYSDDTQLLDMTAGTSPGNFNDAALAVGQTYTDGTYGISVHVISATASALTLSVSTPGGGAPAPAVTGVVSRKTHGAAGVFNLPLSLVSTNPTTEPRLGPAQTMVFQFDKPLVSGTAAVTEGTAVVGTVTFAGNEMTVNLTGVNNHQYLTVAVSNVTAADGGTGGAGSARIGLLAGDVNQSRVVTVSDVGLVNAALAQLVTASNYLKDINASGTLTIADKAIANANLSTALPAP